MAVWEISNQVARMKSKALNEKKIEKRESNFRETA